jgi:hypothetical protein
MNWITIWSLFAAGNVSTLREYSFVDNASLQNNFYRIAEVDMDGRINYSTVNKVRCDDNSEFKLWPNPAINQAWLSVNVITDEKANLKIRDGKGRVVYQKSVSLFAGNNIVSMDTRLLSGGVYLVELTTGQTIKFAKLIKL